MSEDLKLIIHVGLITSEVTQFTRASTLQTDSQTDGQADGRLTVATPGEAHDASRGKN